MTPFRLSRFPFARHKLRFRDLLRSHPAGNFVTDVGSILLRVATCSRCGEVKPQMGLYGILRYSPAFVVRESKVDLRPNISRISSFAKPLRGLTVVLR